MNWIETQIITASAGVDALCAMLTDLGIKGFSIADPADFQEFLQNKEGKWDYIDQDLLGMAQGDTTVTVYLPDNAQGAEQLVALRAMLAQIHARDDAQLFGTLELTLKNVREEDWANNWKQYFKPFTVGERLLIKPSWEMCENPRNRAVLEIDPASSFGTGQHHTTRLCLELLEQLMHPGDRVLDLGCGSGILSIGALLLGASGATAVDIEENAAATATENARKNHIDPTAVPAIFAAGGLIDRVRHHHGASGRGVGSAEKSRLCLTGGSGKGRLGGSIPPYFIKASGTGISLRPLAFYVDSGYNKYI